MFPIFIWIRHSRVCLAGLHWAISFCILSSITGMSLISWFSSPSLGVKTFFISSNSTSITLICSNDFCLINKSLLCYLKSSYFFPDSIIHVPYPVLVGSLWKKHLITSFFTSFVHLFLTSTLISGSFHMHYFLICLCTSLFIVTFCNRSYRTYQCFIYTFLFSSMPKNHSSLIFIVVLFTTISVILLKFPFTRGNFLI